MDTNRGDTQNPNIRCRYVAKGLALTKTDEFFAAMPPLEAMRMLISFVASGRVGSTGDREVLIIDAREAHLHVCPDRDVFVRPPPEIRRKGRCGWLRRCLYGTRDAPAMWEAYYAADLINHGFIRGIASPCVFVHATKDLRYLRCMVHGDDSVVAGMEEDLKWVKERMEESFLIKVAGLLGGDKRGSQGNQSP